MARGHVSRSTAGTLFVMVPNGGNAVLDAQNGHGLIQLNGAFDVRLEGVTLKNGYTQYGVSGCRAARPLPAARRCLRPASGRRAARSPSVAGGRAG